MGIFEKLFGKKDLTASEYAINGEYLNQKGKYKEALKELNKAIELAPNEDMYYASRCKVKKNLKDYKGAAADIEKAISIQPTVTLYQEIKKEVAPFIG